MTDSTETDSGEMAVVGEDGRTVAGCGGGDPHGVVGDQPAGAAELGRDAGIVVGYRHVQRADFDDRKCEKPG
jgi:hypothetical protein